MVLFKLTKQPFHLLLEVEHSERSFEFAIDSIDCFRARCLCLEARFPYFYHKILVLVFFLVQRSHKSY
jgi:hypothetical protein